MKWNILVGSLVLGASLCTPSFAGHGLLDRLLSLKGAGCDSTCCDTNACSADPSCGVESPCGGCAAGPTCGVESPCGGCNAGPSCGVESPCGNGCGAAPTCGVESCGPSCGVESACCKPRRKPLLELLQAAHCKAKNVKNRLHSLSLCNKGCDTGCASACEPTCGVADPSCGCEAPCAAGCAAAPSCGCEAPVCDTGCGCGPKKCGLLSKLFKHKSGCDTCCDAISSCGCTGGAPAAAPAAAGAAPAPPAPVVDPSAYLQNRRVIQPTSYVR
ncbi:MAG: hypothetical protein U0892_20115 [Pirellulales bacterium]